MRDELIRMARDIDGHLNDHARGIDMSWETLVEIVQTAVLAEREACAKLCDSVLGENNVSAAIRARGSDAG